MQPRDRDRGADRLSRDGKASTGRALVIGPYLRPRAEARGDRAARDHAARLEEAVGLARAIDLDVRQSGIVPLTAVTPATYLGKGKAAEFAGLAKAEDVDLVVVDAALTPVQQRNLEKAWSAKVLDRTGLILEIFGRRARTREGTLQVEHAHLSYQRGRLVRSWTHLERQRGGFGFLGGPGETQIEADRRQIEERLAKIERDLDKVKRTRKLHRASRKRVPYPVIALVGYTNAGKSTLFNRLTGGGVMAADMLFATLDPTLRAIALPGGTRAILSDTVGFISDLPTTLIAAFRATLEEVVEADVILHVRDIAHPDTDAQARDVARVLEELDIDAEEGGRVIELWNKVDMLSPEDRDRLSNTAQRQPPDRRPVLTSAVTGEGMAEVAAAIEARLSDRRQVLDLKVAATDGEGLAWLHRNSDVLSRKTRADGSSVMQVRIDTSKADIARRKFAAAATVRGRKRGASV